jgi:hypothetical protein
VKLRLHWRVEPLENGSCVLLDARYSLNGAASLRRKHWHERLHGHCTRMLATVQRLAADPARPAQTSLSVEPAEPQVSRASRTLLAAPRI